MAGDWIKMRANLDTHPKVVSMAAALKTNELHVVGMLWKVWTWADQHSLDGNGVSVTDSFLDRVTSATGFAVALRNVGWLEGCDGSLSFPRFAEHNGQTAKTREETASRVARHRAAMKQKCNGESVTQPLPEKRREEKRREEVKPQATDTPEFELPFASDQFRDAWQDFVAMRSEIKKPLKPTAIKLSLSKLQAMGEATAIRSLKDSTANQWQGLFEPKELSKIGHNGSGQNDPRGNFAAREQFLKMMGGRDDETAS